MIDRPLDLLNALKGKQVVVYMKDGKIERGELVCFDIHINIVLETDKVNYFYKGENIIKVGNK
jgi:small nuclear ribonucleoprotein (snRNP)-like protein